MAAPSNPQTINAAPVQRQDTLPLEQQVAALARELDRLRADFAARLAALEQQCVRQAASGVITLPAPHNLELSVAGGARLTMSPAGVCLVSPVSAKFTATEVQLNAPKVTATGQTAAFSGTVTCALLKAAVVTPAAGNVW